MGITITNSFKGNVLKHLWSFILGLGAVFFLNTMMFANLPMGSTLPIIEVLDQTHFFFSLVALAIFSVAYMSIIAREKTVWTSIGVLIITFTPLVAGGFIDLPHDGRVIAISLLTLTVSLVFFYVVWRWK